MKRLLSIICLVLVSCSENPTISESDDLIISESDDSTITILDPIDCNCGLEIYTDELTYVNSFPPYYELEFNENYIQTFVTLSAQTDCGWSQHLFWDTDYQYLINTDWVSLVNPASMTDENGDANVMFGAWEEFIDYTVTVYCGYTDDHSHYFLDSLKIKIVDDE